MCCTEMQISLGIGALCSPLVSTQFAQLPRWSFHYLTSLGVAFTNFVFLTAVLRFRTQDGTVKMVVFVLKALTSGCQFQSV